MSSLTGSVTVVLGTRPEVVKLAPVVRGLEEFPGEAPVRVLTTGQHRGLLDQMLRVFRLETDADLALMKPKQSLADFGSRVLARLGALFRRDPPAMVVVQGDTSTVFFAALAAFYQGIPVAHVEAGLRSFDMARPFPEEANRVLTGRIASLHFAPTSGARRNLEAEGIPSHRIIVTGNTVVDSLQFMRRRIRQVPPSAAVGSVLRRRRRRILVTVHRRENHGPPLGRVFAAIRRIARQHRSLDVVYPVHPNPNVCIPAERELGDLSNVLLLPPVDYVDFVHLLSRSRLVLTDSGGVQEEAPTFRVPVIVLRDTTERPEGIACGCARLVGTNEDSIVEACRLALVGPKHGVDVNPYGDGKAGVRIARELRSYLEAIKDGSAFPEPRE